MVTTEIGIALCLAPGNAHRRNDCALKNFIFMCQQHATAQPVHSAAVGRISAEVEFGIHHRPLPLPDIPLAMGLKRLGH